MARDTSRGTGKPSPHRVVIIGAGFGGLSAARALRSAAVDVTVIDRTNHHLFQPLLYQVATGVLSEGDIAPPTRDILRRQRNTRVILGEVTHRDLNAREVVIDTVGWSSRVPYDSLIVAAGAAQSYFGHPEFAEHAPGMKTIDDALEVRGRIFGAFEMAELRSDPEWRNHWLTFAVVGAGPTGVELAGQIAELSRRALPRNHRSFDPRQARIVLLEGTDSILASFPAPLQRRARADLERLGVEVQLGARVTAVDLDGLDIERSEGSRGRIQARANIWSAGAHASPLGLTLAAHSDTTTDRAGRVLVDPDCTLPGRPEVFVIGDLMSLDGLPGLAEVAMQSGRHAGQDDHRATKRPHRGTTVPIPRPRHDGDDRALPSGALTRPDSRRRHRGLGRVARGSPRVPDNVQEPSRGGRQLDARLPGTPPPPAHDHRTTGIRKDPRARAV
jgi:NADH dehydrogenase